jgi:hypothetical protein
MAMNVICGNSIAGSATSVKFDKGKNHPRITQIIYSNLCNLRNLWILCLTFQVAGAILAAFNQTSDELNNVDRLCQAD